MSNTSVKSLVLNVLSRVSTTQDIKESYWWYFDRSKDNDQTPTPTPLSYPKWDIFDPKATSANDQDSTEIELIRKTLINLSSKGDSSSE